VFVICVTYCYLSLLKEKLNINLPKTGLPGTTEFYDSSFSLSGERGVPTAKIRMTAIMQ
jgi:hypothetical protein